MARILLTGATSFTGTWIASALAARGHHVVAPLLRREADYEGLRRDRLERLRGVAELRFEHAFAEPAFHALVADGKFDLLAHHAADIPNYRDPAYDVASGVARNLQGGREVLRAMARHGGQAVIVTGTGFEDAAPGGMSVSPYGLSKRLTSEGFRHFAAWEQVSFARFVINGPFGPLEEGRLVWSLFQSWFEGRPGVVRTPAYVRDNIPVVLLAEAYADLVAEMLAEGPRRERDCRPAGYVGAQGDFARKVAAEAEARLGRACPLELLDQVDFPEPYVVANDAPTLNRPWDETGFWDAYIDYYRDVQARGMLARPA